MLVINKQSSSLDVWTFVHKSAVTDKEVEKEKIDISIVYLSHMLFIQEYLGYR